MSEYINRLTSLWYDSETRCSYQDFLMRNWSWERLWSLPKVTARSLGSIQFYLIPSLLLSYFCVIQWLRTGPLRQACLDLNSVLPLSSCITSGRLFLTSHTPGFCIKSLLGLKELTYAKCSEQILHKCYLIFML